MKTKIKIKEGFTVFQPIAKNKWKTGLIEQVITLSIGGIYAVIITDCNEFEVVPIHAIEPIQTIKNQGEQ